MPFSYTHRVCPFLAACCRLPNGLLMAATVSKRQHVRVEHSGVCVLNIKYCWTDHREPWLAQQRDGVVLSSFWSSAANGGWILVETLQVNAGHWIKVMKIQCLPLWTTASNGALSCWKDRWQTGQQIMIWKLHFWPHVCLNYAFKQVEFSWSIRRSVEASMCLLSAAELVTEKHFLSFMIIVTWDTGELLKWTLW